VVRLESSEEKKKALANKVHNSSGVLRKAKRAQKESLGCRSLGGGGSKRIVERVSEPSPLSFKNREQEEMGTFFSERRRG